MVKSTSQGGTKSWWLTKYNKKERKKPTILLTVAIDSVFFSFNWKNVISIFPFVCSIMIKGFTDDADERLVNDSRTPFDILPNVRNRSDRRNGYWSISGRW